MNAGHAALWLLSGVLIVAGLAGTVLPALPGTALILAGIVLGAWIDDFTRIGWGVLTLEVALAVIAWVLDFAAGLLGARRVGASRHAIAGAALGTVAGIFMGFIGLLFMPLVGAAVGEFIARRDQQRAVKGPGDVVRHPARYAGQGRHRVRDDRGVRRGTAVLKLERLAA